LSVRNGSRELVYSSTSEAFAGFDHHHAAPLG
jgi:hypothetical protein